MKKSLDLGRLFLWCAEQDHSMVLSSLMAAKD
jgi:hypothetical protein